MNTERQLAESIARKQLKATGKWFGNEQKQADQQQLKRLRKKYGKQGDITYDPQFKAWILPAGAKQGKASTPAGSAVPTRSSRMRLS